MDRTRSPETDAADKTAASSIASLLSPPPFAPESFLAAPAPSFPPTGAPTTTAMNSNAADKTPSSSEIDVMAQLAYFNSVSASRNRSFSAPIPPSSLGATWRAFSDDTSVLPEPSLSPPPVLNMRVSSVQVENAAGAIGSAVPSSLVGDMHGLQLSQPTATPAAATVEPENEPTNHQAALAASAAASGGSATDKAAAEPVGAPLPATFLRTICDQLEFYFCDENLLGDLFLLKNMNMDGYGALVVVSGRTDSLYSLLTSRVVCYDAMQ